MGGRVLQIVAKKPFPWRQFGIGVSKRAIQQKKDILIPIQGFFLSD
jgi:hypothetical protein